MLLDYDRYLSYICPVCGQTTQRRIVPFNLSGNKAVFSCGDSACGKEIFTVIQKRINILLNIFVQPVAERIDLQSAQKGSGIMILLF